MTKKNVWLLYQPQYKKTFIIKQADFVQQLFLEEDILKTQTILAFKFSLRYC